MDLGIEGRVAIVTGGKPGDRPRVEGMMDREAEARGVERDRVERDRVVRDFLDEARPHIEVGRPGRIDEVGPVVAFPCSEVASFVNGANYRVDGGSVASA